MKCGFRSEVAPNNVEFETRERERTRRIGRAKRRMPNEWRVKLKPIGKDEKLMQKLWVNTALQSKRAQKLIKKKKKKKKKIESDRKTKI